MRVPTSSTVVFVMALAMIASAQAQDVEVAIDGVTASASRGSDRSEGELTSAEQHVLKVADAAQRARIEQLAGHRLLGLPLQITGTLERGEYVAGLRGETLTYAFKGVSTFGPERDAFADMQGQTITISGLATLSEDEVAPQGTKVGESYFAEPIYTQWPDQRRAELEISGQLGPEQVRSGRVEGGRLIEASGSIQIVGTTARWLRDNHDGARATVRGFTLNIQPEPVFVVSHVKAGARKMGVKVKTASPLGGFGGRLLSKKARWFSRVTYGESASIRAPAGSLYLSSAGGFVRGTDVKLIDTPAEATSGLSQGLGGK